MALITVYQVFRLDRSMERASRRREEEGDEEHDPMYVPSFPQRFTDGSALTNGLCFSLLWNVAPILVTLISFFL
jgi:hypothetical protein